ncbi:Hypothetical predicted protein [Lecanosticta acicola]|uniref:Uncharacterized protein n=1 Tax=Lecanosticta acicola TaxID=111012 RepID=A0AAI9EE93_9PEZI|nr:Hypothetical predicted protein [Lecanosticta acicola]
MSFYESKSLLQLRTRHAAILRLLEKKDVHISSQDRQPAVRNLLSADDTDEKIACGHKLHRLVAIAGKHGIEIPPGLLAPLKDQEKLSSLPEELLTNIIEQVILARWRRELPADVNEDDLAEWEADVLRPFFSTRSGKKTANAPSGKEEEDSAETKRSRLSLFRIALPAFVDHLLLSADFDGEDRIDEEIEDDEEDGDFIDLQDTINDWAVMHPSRLRKNVKHVEIWVILGGFDRDIDSSNAVYQPEQHRRRVEAASQLLPLLPSIFPKMRDLNITFYISSKEVDRPAKPFEQPLRLHRDDTVLLPTERQIKQDLVRLVQQVRNLEVSKKTVSLRVHSDTPVVTEEEDRRGKTRESAEEIVDMMAKQKEGHKYEFELLAEKSEQEIADEKAREEAAAQMEWEGDMEIDEIV